MWLSLELVTDAYVTNIKLIQTAESLLAFDCISLQELAEILWEKYAVPRDVASAACSSYLKAFRKCPENLKMDLDTWRHLLWTQALGDQYHMLAGDIYRKWLQLRYQYLSLPPDVLNLLSKLHKNYLLGLITNGPSRAQWEKVERLNLHSYFDIILVSGDLPWEKPNQQIFHEACGCLNVEPRQCLMVGDKLETDILGGIQANLGGTVWIPLTTDILPHKEFNPDYVLDNVTELLALLPNNPKVPESIFRYNKEKNASNVSLDLDDCNSNSSDGS
ncbi:hypothetical protein Trydic_g2105 [Trypoxylus dichotomus]